MFKVGWLGFTNIYYLSHVKYSLIKTLCFSYKYAKHLSPYAMLTFLQSTR